MLKKTVVSLNTLKLLESLEEMARSFQTFAQSMKRQETGILKNRGSNSVT